MTPEMAGAVGHSYSLWLEPPAGTLRDRLQREIRAQSAAHGGPYFEPHVTHLGDVHAVDEQALLDTAAALARRLKVWWPRVGGQGAGGGAGSPGVGVEGRPGVGASLPWAR